MKKNKAESVECHMCYREIEKGTGYTSEDDPDKEWCSQSDYIRDIELANYMKNFDAIKEQHEKDKETK